MEIKLEIFISLARDYLLVKKQNGRKKKKNEASQLEEKITHLGR